MDKSLQDGTIDVYPEYTGTAYVAILKKPPESYPKTEKETYEQVAEFYRNRKDTPMQMLQPAPFENNYGIVMLTKEADKMGIETLDDLAAKSDQLIFSSYSEFQNRSDGYENMQEQLPEARLQGHQDRQRPRHPLQGPGRGRGRRRHRVHHRRPARLPQAEGHRGHQGHLAEVLPGPCRHAGVPGQEQGRREDPERSLLQPERGQDARAQRRGRPRAGETTRTSPGSTSKTRASCN